MSARAALSHWQSSDPRLAGRSLARPKSSRTCVSFPEHPMRMHAPGKDATHYVNLTHRDFVLPAPMCSRHRGRGWRYSGRQAMTVLPKTHQTKYKEEIFYDEGSEVLAQRGCPER